MADHIKDITRLPEDERVRLIGETASEGKSVGVLLDHGNVERIIQKVITRYPTVCVLSRIHGPATVVVVKFGRLESSP